MSGPDTSSDWDHAPCGLVVARPDGRILRANATIADWLGYSADELRDRTIGGLLTVGGRIHYDTHFGPLLLMSGELKGITLDLVAADGERMPMFVTANVETDAAGRPELLRITAVDATDRRGYERELVEQRQRAEEESRRVRAFAETLRRSLLPPVLSPPPGMDAAEYYYAASADDIGGDFYDLFPLSPTRWGFFLGDVEGKGVQAAVVTGVTRYALRSAAVFDHDPTRVLGNLNSVIRQHFAAGGRRLCTLIYGNVVASGDGFDIELASGGHLPPLLLGADGTAYYVDSIGGQAVGMTGTPHFMAVRLHLAPGDTLVLYTDGLTEASTGIGRERYDDRGALLRLAKTAAPASAQGIVAAIGHLLDRLGAGVQDDVAVLALGVPRVA